MTFNTVNHNIPLDKLFHYGVRGIENNWFKTYLTNIKQHVTVNGQTSDDTLVEFGVTQGSVLGPTSLFDIHQLPKSSHKI